jgi:hypothetical protein
LRALAGAFERPAARVTAKEEPSPTVQLPFAPLRYLAEQMLARSAPAAQAAPLWHATLRQLAALSYLDDLIVERAADGIESDAGTLQARAVHGRLSPGDTAPFVVTTGWGSRTVTYLLPKREFAKQALRAFMLEIDARRSTVSLRLYDAVLFTVHV